MRHVGTSRLSTSCNAQDLNTTACLYWPSVDKELSKSMVREMHISKAQDQPPWFLPQDQPHLQVNIPWHVGAIPHATCLFIQIPRVSCPVLFVRTHGGGRSRRWRPGCQMNGVECPFLELANCFWSLHCLHCHPFDLSPTGFEPVLRRGFRQVFATRPSVDPEASTRLGSI